MDGSTVQAKQTFQNRLTGFSKKSIHGSERSRPKTAYRPMTSKLPGRKRDASLCIGNKHIMETPYVNNLDNSKRHTVSQQRSRSKQKKILSVFGSQDFVLNDGILKTTKISRKNEAKVEYASDHSFNAMKELYNQYTTNKANSRISAYMGDSNSLKKSNQFGNSSHYSKTVQKKKLEMVSCLS